MRGACTGSAIGCAERIQHVNRIKGLCATQGIHGYEPLRRDRCGLEDLRTGDGRALPPAA